MRAPVPNGVADIRRQNCKRAGCTAALDYDDPCEACPQGHFQRYMRAGCDEPGADTGVAPRPERDPSEAAAATDGPGTRLKALLGRIGIVASPGCSCIGRAREMDRMGPEWCERNAETIVGWLKEEATKRRLPFSAVLARLLVKRSISSARRDSASRLQA